MMKEEEGKDKKKKENKKIHKVETNRDNNGC